MRRTLIAVNPYAKTGTIRVIDKKRYKMLRMRQKKALDFYNRNHQRLEAAYKSKAAYLTSAEFWKSYLDI